MLLLFHLQVDEEGVTCASTFILKLSEFEKETWIVCVCVCVCCYQQEHHVCSVLCWARIRNFYVIAYMELNDDLIDGMFMLRAGECKIAGM